MCLKEERQILRYYNILNYEPDISQNRIRALFVINQIQRETNHCLLQIMDVRGREKAISVNSSLYMCKFY